MALGTVQAIVATGVTPVYATPLSSESITPGEDQFLHVKNASGGAVTVTLVDAGSTPGASAATNPTVSVPATTGDKMIYLNPNYVNPATGFITVNFSATASVTAALMRV